MMFWILSMGLVFLIWIWQINKTYHILAFFAPRIKTENGTVVENIVPTLPGKTVFGNTFDTFGLDFVNLLKSNKTKNESSRTMETLIIFGNTFDTFGLDFVGTFNYVRNNAAQMKRSYVQYLAGKTILNIIDAEMAEMVFTNTKLISKGFVYEFLKPALGEGLLLSTDRKWHSRRKMLTPAFHFNILLQFQEIFREESQKFIKGLETMDTEVVLLDEVIPKLTLNVVYETALGVKLDACQKANEYRKSFHVFEECFNKRTNNPYLMNDFIYKTFEEEKYLPALKIVHEFSSDIIKKRRELYAKEREQNGNQVTEEFGISKKRYAMLDTLLRAEEENLIDHDGICEEVDTFMFEGYDTTSMGLIFNLMNLSLYPEMQRRCYEEILQNIDDLHFMNIPQLSKLKYLECFMKETLRLYPSVPAIMREAVEETKLPNGLILPAKTYITLHLFDMQRNVKHFDNPNSFDPDRFMTESSKERNPYAFSPFSAGQRNCIGQKFAMLEMKTLLAFVIKNFEILPLVDPSRFDFKSGIIIRTKDAVKVKLIKRK